MSAFRRGALSPLLLLLATAVFLLAPSAEGAFIKWQNCLDENIVNSDPLQLQWVPLFFDANFQTEPPYNLRVTLYGNVSGQAVVGDYPPPSDPSWDNPENTFGKIAETGNTGEFNSTLVPNFKVLTYEAWDATKRNFCSSLVNGTCPLGPSFSANASDPSQLHAFSIEHDFGSPYRFSTLAATIRVISGDSGAPDLACVSANITPDLGDTVRGLVMWLPAVVLILKGVATLVAAIWSPWGSSDIFRWSSNYGRDEDLLRLVTPGFGDCLQYIQFVTLMGSLTLQFPGFFQPALAQTGWSLLLFNESYVSGDGGRQSLIDGVYATNGTYGIATMRQLIGMSSVDDVWACMAVWFLVIAVIVVVLCQFGFLGRWIYRAVSKTSEEDLRQKNIPFTVGNLVRLVFNFFILPIVAISLFQLVISSDSPTSVVATAAILFVLVVACGGWILYVVFTTKPRTYLFDDMPTVLLYGPLYNTYSDSAAPFALVPVLITFMRAIAFGALQPSGIAQIIVLAICEVILILTLNGFRPFQSQTSMNAYHTFFSVVRLTTVMLCIAFVPTLGVTEAPKGWIGYVILLLHACVLVFGFFLNAAQTLIEVAARTFGLAGHDAQTGAVRGSILNWRMLKKRKGRPEHDRDGSMTSNAAFLHQEGADARSNRTRSMSASSQQLLNQAGRTPSMNRLSGFENFSSGPEGARTPSTDLGHATNRGKRSSLATKSGDDAFYRAPRKRANTFDALNPGAKSRSEDGSSNPYQDSPSTNPRESSYDRGKDSPAPAYLRDKHDSSENLPRPDYAVREVDQYYRGAALSDQPTRKLKTGPADPQGPVVAAQSWFQRIFGGENKKTKQPGKGFEVVRSSRAPPGMQAPAAGHGIGMEDVEMQSSPPMNQEPYRDDPEAGAGAERGMSPLVDNEPGPQRESFNFGLDGGDTNKYAGTGGAATGIPTLHRPPTPEERDSPPMHPGLRAEQPSRKSPSFEQSLQPRPSFQSHETIYTHETSGASRYGGTIGRASSEYDDMSRRSTMRGQHRPAPSLGVIQGMSAFDTPQRQNSQHNRSRTEGGGGMADDWLREVDQLAWSHGGSQSPQQIAPAQTYYPPGSMANRQASGQRQLSSYRNANPGIPRRSSRRTPSQEQNTSPQFSDFTSSDNSRFQGQSRSRDRGGSDDDFLDFDSGNRGDERERNAMNPSHHRAADSIHRNSFGASAAMRGMSAEMSGGSVPQQSRFGEHFEAEERGFQGR